MAKLDFNNAPKSAKILGIIVIALILIGIGADIGQSGKQTNLTSTNTSANTGNANSGSNTTGSLTAGSKVASSTTPATTPKPAPKATTTKSTTSTTTTKTTSSPAPAAPKVLLSLSGNGIENSSPFLVTESQLTVTYSYDCSSQGGNGNFIADLEYGNQSSLSGDDQSIANALGAGATNVTTTIYPADPGKDYYLAVNSECSWTVTVSS